MPTFHFVGANIDHSRRVIFGKGVPERIKFFKEKLKDVTFLHSEHRCFLIREVFRYKTFAKVSIFLQWQQESISISTLSGF